MSANGVVVLPLRVLLGLAGEISSVAGTLTLPSLSMLGSGAPNGGSLVLPLPLLSGSSNTQTLHCSGSVTLPLFSFTGTFGVPGELTLPGLEFAGTGYPEPLAIGSLDLPRIITFGTATPGQLGAGTLVLPVRVFSSTTHHQSLASGALVLPSLVVLGVGIALASSTSAVSHRTVVINTRNMAVTEYLEFNFDSFCEFPVGVFLAAGPTGLYKIYSTADADNGNLVNAELQFGTTNFGENTKKNCPDGFVNYRGNGRVELNALADELATPDVFATAEAADTRLRNYKFKLSKFRNGINWRFSIKNIEGSSMDINEVAVYYDILSRRI
jgi:hypothetical protein